MGKTAVSDFTDKCILRLNSGTDVFLVESLFCILAGESTCEHSFGDPTVNVTSEGVVVTFSFSLSYNFS